MSFVTSELYPSNSFMLRLLRAKSLLSNQKSCADLKRESTDWLNKNKESQVSAKWIADITNSKCWKSMVVNYVCVCVA
jgi:hypothetical protein